MNPIEQKTHTRVTTAIARDLQALTEEWAMNFQTFADRLDLHQRQINDRYDDQVTLRLELSKLTDIIARLSDLTGKVVEPLRRETFTGRLSWLLWGRDPVVCSRHEHEMKPEMKGL